MFQLRFLGGVGVVPGGLSWFDSGASAAAKWPESARARRRRQVKRSARPPWARVTVKETI